jgi:hypothetical protein
MWFVVGFDVEASTEESGSQSGGHRSGQEGQNEEPDA